MQNVRNKVELHVVRNEGIFKIVSLLKASANQKDLQKGSEIHAYIDKHEFLDKNTYIASSLISMYARCGALGKAQEVLHNLPVRDVVTWNALIAGYVQQGKGDEALKCFDSMQWEGHSPNVVTFTCALKACGSIGAAIRGEEIHDKIISLGMEKDIFIGSTLIEMYTSFDALAKAQKVLQELPVRNVVMWTALIAGYVKCGQGEEALKCFDDMQHEGLSPDAPTFTCALKACGSIGALSKGEQIHKKISNIGLLENNCVLRCTLMDMYARCGALTKAQQVFEELPVRDMFSWTTLIAGYVQLGYGDKALKWFDCMQWEGLSPDVATITSTLKACASIGAAAKGKQIHDKMVGLGMLKDVELGSILVDMYARCGALAQAQQVLEELSNRNVVTWTALMSGHVKQGQWQEALTCFDNMEREGHYPDEVAFIYALKACGNIGLASKGEQVHDKIVSLGVMEKSIVLGNTLMDMYVKCGALVMAQKVLKELPVRNVVTWNILIAGYNQQGQGDEALKCFVSMEGEGQSPDEVTFTYALKACASIGAVATGGEIHEKIVKLGILKKSLELGNTLVDMYARCGALAKAGEVLKELPVRDAVTWTALIGGYTQQGQGEEALMFFDHMQCEGLVPTVSTFLCALKACALLGTVAKGEEIHDKFVSLGLLEKSIELRNMLIYMYAKCAELAKAQQVLEELPAQNVVTWTALIAGYAQQGQSVEALNCFERMQSKGLTPDSTTLTCVLNACRHSGLLNEAEMMFSQMSTKYGLIPVAEHYCCMVDLFGRAGEFNRAILVSEKMPFFDYLPMWVALLGAACMWGNVEVGKFAFEHALNLDKSNATIYICLANMCSISWHARRQHASLK